MYNWRSGLFSHIYSDGKMEANEMFFRFQIYIRYNRYSHYHVRKHQKVKVDIFDPEIEKLW